LSTFAVLYLIDEPNLSGLKNASAAGPTATDAYMAEHIREIATFDGSGSIFGSLLAHLEKKHDIHLQREVLNIIGLADWVLTVEDRNAYLDRLDPDLFGLDELRAAFEEFYRTSAPDVGQFMQKGVAFLREGLRNTSPTNLVLLSVH